MAKFFKIFIFLIFSLSLIFIIFRNLGVAEDAKTSEPTEEEINELFSIQTKNSANTYENKDVDEENLITMYYVNFKNEIINSESDAYSKIRNKDEITKEIFDNFRNELINNYYINTVSSYEIRKENGKDVYYITNNYNQTIILYINSIFNYEIELNL